MTNVDIYMLGISLGFAIANYYNGDYFKIWMNLSAFLVILINWLFKPLGVYHIIFRMIFLYNKEIANRADYYKFIIAHELAHALGLPNNGLLANAYAINTGHAFLPKLIEYIENIKESEQLKDKIAEYKFGIKHIESRIRFLILADEALKVMPVLVAMEPVIRKISSTPDLVFRLENCSTRKEIRDLLLNVSINLRDEDYAIPNIIADGLHKWVYGYGLAIGYIAAKRYGSSDKALQYIYRLGQARDSRELKGFEPQETQQVNMPPKELKPPVHPGSAVDSLARQPGMAI
jgi:hypothetical protein